MPIGLLGTRQKADLESLITVRARSEWGRHVVAVVVVIVVGWCCASRGGHGQRC